MRRIAATMLVLLLGGLSSPAVQADDGKAEARKQFEIGERLYRLGQFEAALKAYSRAYEAKPLAGFLFNIGQCHRELGNFDRAVHFYESYLRDKPDAKNRKIVQDLIEECNQKHAEQQERARLEAEERQRKAEEARRIAEAKAARERMRLEQERLANERMKAAMAAEEEAARRKAEEEGKVWKQWWFWTAIGGAVAVAGGVTAGVLASQGETRTRLPAGSLGTLDRRGE